MADGGSEDMCRGSCWKIYRPQISGRPVKNKSKHSLFSQHAVAYRPPAAGEHVQTRVVDLAVDFQQTEHRMEQVVLAQGFVATLLQAMGVYRERLLITVGKPRQHCHMLLLFRRHHVRRAMEE